jgi:hypothetical protein
MPLYNLMTRCIAFLGGRLRVFDLGLGPGACALAILLTQSLVKHLVLKAMRDNISGF